ncbi:glycosyltransferase family 4 protein [Prolixibacter sp. NT017]|uniref:glycosyltransferase family 4 protein n=1 Tax=Prolixibacter sp. NT017 TaxID=2652390 RepID=UPI0012993359|nr:MraY family glycosyltransferase [Prolixibacter sp. NT017]
MPEIIYVILSFGLSLLIAVRSIPTIISVAHQKHLFDEPNGRSAATQVVPTLGGIAIFLGFVLSVTIAGNGFVMPGLKYILAAVIIMFFVGLKDDILSLSPWKKLAAQLASAFMLIVLADIRFTNLHGFMGIHEISYPVSFLLSGFVMIVFINAFNLIDGIDGLASGISIIAAGVLGVWFYLAGHIEYTILAFSLIGALSGFFYFNVYGKKNKIFMGDTGSLILGTIMSVLVIQFNELNIIQTRPFAIASAPAVSFGILIYPLFDTIRVFAIRMYQGRSPFSPDKNHIHHRLLALGMSHKQATFTLLAVSALYVVPVFLLQGLGIWGLMAVNLTFAMGSVMLLGRHIQIRQLIRKDDPFQQILIPRRNERLIDMPGLERQDKKPAAVRRGLVRALSQLDKISFW